MLERLIVPVRHKLSPRCRNHIGLASGLGADLGINAIPQAQRQRDAECDDGQQQQVGRGQEKAGSQGYGATTSEAMNRKPTPRTVSM
jgi:hypothetical protein